MNENNLKECFEPWACNISDECPYRVLHPEYADKILDIAKCRSVKCKHLQERGSCDACFYCGDCAGYKRL